MRLIAVIPNYNHGKTLTRLLRQLLDKDFDAICVLDDASTDDSLKLLAPFADKIEIIKGPYNIGPGGNRNRIIPHIKDSDIIMFVDADMEFISEEIRQPVLNLFKSHPDVAMFGGGIKTKDDKPMTYNYGLHCSQLWHLIGLNIEHLAVFVHFKPLVKLIRPGAKYFTLNVEIRFFEPVERSVDSVSEGHFYVRADVFKEMNGFNDTLRYHEGGELAYRIRKAGYDIKFTPAVWARHLQIHPRNKLRVKEAKKLDKIIKEDDSTRD